MKHQADREPDTACGPSAALGRNDPMRHQPANPLIRFAAASVSRRGSLGALAGAALAVAATDGPNAEAKKRNRKKTKTKTKNKRCQRQVGACQEIVTSFCEDAPDPARCRSAFLPCCDPLADCQTREFVVCIDEVIQRAPNP